MYVCGPTVYGEPHLGHGRFSLVFDVLRRYIEWSGTPVRYVSNITDIDDKIVELATSEGRSVDDVTAQYEAAWWDAMDALEVIRPTESPHARAWVDQMVDLVSALIDRGIAYVTDDGVYLSVDQVDGYGLLAHQDLSTLRTGARVEIDEEKRSPLDFALWKRAEPGEPWWDAPFGKGRPGWHTECVVMSLALLGDGFDLHGGGLDLAFPHHENERAQAVALGREFARHWVHNGFVEVEGQKMSKSLGNFTSLPDMLGRADKRAYRLLVLRSHYRSPIEVTQTTVSDAEAALSRLDGLARRFGLGPELSSVKKDEARARGADEESLEAFSESMDDDLDTPQAVALVFDLAKRANSLADSGEPEAAWKLAATAAILCGALGLMLRSRVDDPDDETLGLVQAREEARAGRDFARADALRDEIHGRGWVVEDSQDGPRLHRP